MGKRLSRFEKNKISELELAGVAIDDIYGSKKASPFFLCISKAIIIFMVCVGTVTGFADAFSLNYNKSLIVFTTLLISVLISLLYYKKKIFYIGYIAFLIIFTVELLRYYLYANSGFQAIMNRVREVYAEHFNMSVVRSAEESLTNRYVTITITLIFIIAFLVVMYNITVSRYMNFAETFGISFIILEIPLYIGYKPPLISVILIMTGCICTGLLQKGAFNRVTIPGKNAPDYIRDRIFKKTYYTTRGSHKGILMMLGVSLVFSFVMCLFSLPVFNRDLGETPEDSAKATLDDSIKILVQNGFYGLFNRYDSINGLNRGVLGGVSSVSPDFKTDLVVSFVPYGKETVYLPGFKGVTYGGMNWYNRLATADFPELKIEKKEYLASTDIDTIDINIDRVVVNPEASAYAEMQISYLDKSFGMMVSPYITYRNSTGEQLYVPNESENEVVLETKQMYYYPLEKVGYVGWQDKLNALEGLSPDEYIVYALSDELTSSYLYSNGDVLSQNSEKGLAYDDYIYDVYTKVPDDLNRYLTKFCLEHDNFGIKDQKNYRYYTNKVRDNRHNIGQKALNIIYNMSEELTSQALLEEELEEIYADKDKVNEYRLEICEAVKDMFLNEYPYTLSPGKTPTNSDFVRYFLEEQKRGFCSHFASAATMILRHMGIPARYVEGYCIPNSLIRESAIRLNMDGSTWYNGENEYNPDKAMYQVEVSDYYAHAWVEVYLEGKGFVPFEFTPPNYEAIPEPTQLSGIGRFFSRILNVDLGFGNSSSEGDSLSITGDVDTPAIEEKSDMNLGTLVLPLAILIGVVVLFWMLFLLIRKIVLEVRYSRYLKEGRFAPLVFARYNELVKKLRRRKIVKAINPLPMEVLNTLAEYKASDPEKMNSDNGFSPEIYNEKCEEYNPIFVYIEKVLYSDYISNPDEYKAFFEKIKSMV